MLAPTRELAQQIKDDFAAGKERVVAVRSVSGAGQPWGGAAWAAGGGGGGVAEGAFEGEDDGGGGRGGKGGG